MARPGRVSDFTAQVWLTDLRNRATHLGLSLQDPFSTPDPLTVEPQSTGYVRARVTWTLTGRLLRNAIAVSWTGLPAGTRVVAITLWDQAINGTFLGAIPIAAPELPTGGGFPVAANNLFFGLDV